MKNYLFPFVLIVGYAVTQSTTVPPFPTPAPPLIVKPQEPKLPIIIPPVPPATPVGIIWNDWAISAPVQPPALTDYAPYFQHIIDSCINNNIPSYYMPAGRFPMSEPLILHHTIKNNYVFFTIQLIGTGTAGESDGSGTILDWTTAPHSAFGLGVQEGKGVIVKGIKLWGAFNYKLTNAYTFYNTPLSGYTDGICKDTEFGPYSGIVIDPFGPAEPANGTGFTGTDAYGVSLSTYYRGNRSGSTGVHVTECFITGWVADIITSPNGRTQNADNLTFDFLQIGNSKIGIAGCQDQEKNNTASHIQEWGVMHTCFCTGLYGAGSTGNWFLDHWNIAGHTQQIVYNNQGGYFPSYFDNIFAESVARVGFIASVNGTRFTNSTLNFAGYVEAGSYTSDMISGYGVTFDGCQLRIYGQGTPVTIQTGVGANNFHFVNCSFDCVPVYPQSYTAGYSDFLNCYVGAESPANILNPLGPSRPSIYAYPTTSNVAAKAFLIDGKKHQFMKSGSHYSSVIRSDSTVALKDVILASPQGQFMDVAGVVTAVGTGQFTVSYSPASIDSTKQYYLYRWKTMMK
jgi:hypothetical protein